MPNPSYWEHLHEKLSAEAETETDPARKRKLRIQAEAADDVCGWAYSRQMNQPPGLYAASGILMGPIEA